MRKHLQKTRNNIIILLIIKGFTSLASGWVIINILFFNELGYNYFKISNLFSLESVIVIFSGLIVGFLSDSRSRKSILIAASMFQLFSVLILLIDYSIIGVIIWAIFSGLAFASSTGVYEALFYENLRTLKRTELYSSTLSLSYIIFVIIGAGSAFLYPFIFGIDSFYPIYISLFFSILATIFSLFLYERRKSRVLTKGKGLRTFRNKLKLSIMKIRKSHILYWIMFFDAIWLMGLWLFEEFYSQPFIKLFYNMSEYGLIFGVSMLIQAVIIKYLDRYFIKERFYGAMLLSVSSAFVFTSLLLFFPQNMFIVIFSVSILFSLKNFVLIQLSHKTNDDIKRDGIRNMIISASASVSVLIYAIVLPIVGLIIEWIQIKNTLFYSNILFGVIGIIFMIWLRFAIMKK